MPRKCDNQAAFELAARVGMNASKISQIESSPRKMTLDTVGRLAHALNRKVRIEFVPVNIKKTSMPRARKRAALAR
jgi:transcriptional regulator with XRE-family HTH domain